MMCKNKAVMILCFLCVLTVIGLPGFCGDFIPVNAGTKTKASSGGSELSQLRFGFIENGEYGSDAQVLLEMARQLVEEGSISRDFRVKYDGVDFEESFSAGDTEKLWNDICDTNVEGARYCFVRDAFFNMEEMDEKDYPLMANREDTDITFAMGTAPGVYLVENEKKNKFMCIYAGDPVASGIVDPDNRNDTAFAVIDDTAYARQLEGGYKFLQFKKLGVVYEDSEDAYAYSAISVVEDKAKEHGFDVVYEYVDEPVDDEDYNRYYRELKQAYRKLVDAGIDCLYITVASIDYEAKLQELLDDAIIPAGVKTLAQDDFLPLPYGSLFGVTITDAEETAGHVIRQFRSYAEEGVPFSDLDIVCECTPRIGLNFTTAKRIDFHPSFEDLQMVDRIFRNKDIEVR